MYLYVKYIKNTIYTSVFNFFFNAWDALCVQVLERWLQNLKGDTHKDTSSGENGDTHKDTSLGENGDTSDAGKETPAADNGDTCKDTPAGDPSDIAEDMPAGDEGKVTPASDTTMVTPAGDSGVCVSCLGVLQQGHCSIEFLDKVS